MNICNSEENSDTLSLIIYKIQVLNTHAEAQHTIFIIQHCPRKRTRLKLRVIFISVIQKPNKIYIFHKLPLNRHQDLY